MNDNTKQLDELIADHKAEAAGVEPHKDLWPGIEARLEAREQHVKSGTKTTWAVAGLSALAASVMAVAVVIGLQAPTNVPAGESDWYLLAEQMNQVQTQQVNGLLAGYELSGYQASTPDYQQQLTQLRQSKQQLITSMQKNGGNAQMLDMLRWINEQELQLLKRAYQQQQPDLQEI